MAKYYLGDIKLKENHFKDAILFFTRMKESNKVDLKQIAIFNLGKCHFQQKEFILAAPLFLEAYESERIPALLEPLVG